MVEEKRAYRKFYNLLRYDLTAWRRYPQGADSRTLLSMLTLHPKTVALIGASDDASKLGHIILKNLIEGGYTGKIYPVNPKHEEILGKKCAKDIESISDEVDLAVIVTPASTVPAIAEACGKKNVKMLAVISAGFGETGTEEGKEAEAELRRIQEQYGTTVIGPNCLGLLLPHIGLNASFAMTPKEKGSVALISQSGAMAVALLDAADAEKMGFSAVFSIGNKAATDEADILQVLAEDPNTTVIGLYIESIGDGLSFVESARRISPTKPIVILKAGTSAQGASAVRSHTGALAGSTAALDAACRAAGIVRADDTATFVRLLRALSTRKTLPKNTIGIITNAGGPGVLATDAAEKAGLVLPRLSKKSEAALKKALPPAASTHNPIDVLGDAGADRYAAALKAAAEDPEIEGLVCLLTPQVMTPCEEMAASIIKVASLTPLLPIVSCFMGGGAVEKSKNMLRDAGLVVTETPEEAMSVMRSLYQPAVPESEREETPRDDDRCSAAHGLLKGKSGHMDDVVTAELLALYGLEAPTQEVADSAKDAARIAEAIGFPVVAKVSAKDILHKTDIGCVKTNLRTPRQAEAAFLEILKNAKKHAPTSGVHGVLMQKQLSAGSEFIVGALRDPAFGPMVMVGLGGIYTELFRDTSFRLAPISVETALTMLTELRSWKLLLGLRGKEALNIEGLAEVVAKTSALISECDKIAEIDLNPVLVDEASVTVADAKIVLKD